MVTPATIGWNIVSISWSPGKYTGAWDGVGELQQRRVDEDREQREERGHRERRGELDDEEVRPGVDLVGRHRLDVLDGSGLDDGQQALGVPARADDRRGGAAARRGARRAFDRGDTATLAARGAAALSVA